MNSRISKQKANNDIKTRIINRQVEEIKSLNNTILELQAECKKKDEMIESVEVIRNDLNNTLEVLRLKSNEYDKLISELKDMKKAFNKKAFNGKWYFTRFLPTH